ncbi:Alpha-mannosidase 2, partial [Orchesella cincta]
KLQNKFSTDFDSVEVYPQLNFTASWTKSSEKHFWNSKDFDFEGRYKKENAENTSVTPANVQIYLLPFSHNDPGWLRTFEGYFYSKSKHILNHSVSALPKYENMTFAWSEIAFLSKWWDEASPAQKEVFKELVTQGRIEILTGGWVMADEGTSTLYGLVHQLTEGHTWLKSNLNFMPNAAWSIDPFGHSSTMPYLLKAAGVDIMVIQVCMKFDFRRINGKKEEHLRYMNFVSSQNLPALASALISQYRRTASLTQHNIVFTALGGDFRFEEALEWEQQYSNYRKLFDYINSRPELEQYHSTAQFGTLASILIDVIFAFSPSYWSGFYGTRPFWKQLIREVEDELRKTEIIFTFSYNLLKQRNHPEEVIGHNYDNLVQARRSVALFQHHDGVTGTSPRTTMLDYSKKLTQAWNFLKQIQKVGIEAIWKHELKMEIPPLAEETSRKNHTHTGQKNPIKLYENTSVVKKVLLYNSLGWKIPRLVRLVVETLNVTVKGPGGEEVLSQINLKYDPGSHEPTNQSYELVFVAKLPPLSVVTYEISQQVESEASSAKLAEINCTHCNNLGNSVEGPNITLENSRFFSPFQQCYWNVGEITRQVT